MRGQLTEELLQSITSDTERVRAAFVSSEGLRATSGDEQERVWAAAVMVVTDRRVLFVTDIGESGTETTGLPYGELAAVSLQDGRTLECTTTEGTAWRFSLPETDSDTVDAVCRHCLWVGELRSRLVSCRNDVELGAGSIESSATEMEWDTAESTYERLRRQLDRLICAVQWTEPIDEEVIAPELTSMERTLESACARLFIEQANSQLSLGQQLIDNGDYEQARTVLGRARSYYRRAKHRSEAVERGDAFQFGTQRTVKNDLEELGWEIDMVAAEPLRQAHEATVRAKHADDPTDAIHHWESAFRRFNDVLTLEWSEEDRHFAGDCDRAREEIVSIARRLVDLYTSQADELWGQSTASEQAGDIEAAVRGGEIARSHLDRAAELAREFVPGRTGEIQRRRDEIREHVMELRRTSNDRANAADGDHEDGAESATASSNHDETDSRSTDRSDGDLPSIDDIPTLEDVTSIDTHHEIALDLADPQADESDEAADNTSEKPEDSTVERETDTIEQE